MNTEFFQRRKTELEDAFLAKNAALDMIDYLKVGRISQDEYFVIREFFEKASAILLSDLEYTDRKLQSEFRPKYGRNHRLTRAQSKLLPDREY